MLRYNALFFIILSLPLSVFSQGTVNLKPIQTGVFLCTNQMQQRGQIVEAGNQDHFGINAVKLFYQEIATNGVDKSFSRSPHVCALGDWKVNAADVTPLEKTTVFNGSGNVPVVIGSFQGRNGKVYGILQER